MSPEQASNFVQELGSSAMALHATHKADSDKLQDAYKDLVRRSLDQEVIGRFALCRTWRRVTSAQRHDFMGSRKPSPVFLGVCNSKQPMAHRPASNVAPAEVFISSRQPRMN